MSDSVEWWPTPRLRFVQRKDYLGTDDNLRDLHVTRNVLQQQWISNTQELEWRDVPLVQEED